MSAAETAIDKAAQALGVELLPWQREVGERILNGELVLMPSGRRAGRATLRRVLDTAQKPGEQVYGDTP